MSSRGPRDKVRLDPCLAQHDCSGRGAGTVERDTGLIYINEEI